jgi:hypothetical protein
LGDGPALVAGRVEADELADPRHVVVDPEELLRVLARRGAGKAGEDGVDEHEVGGGEPGVLVIDDRVRRRGDLARVCEQEPFGPGRADVQPDRGRPGPAVEYERHRPGGAILRRGECLVRDEEQVGLVLAGVVLHRQRAGRSRGS